MIVMDTPRMDWFRGRRIRTAHVVSSILGAEGHQELLAFALSIGMKAEWIQSAGTYREHFDLMGSRCDAAINAGAVVSRLQLANALRLKSGRQPVA